MYCKNCGNMMDNNAVICVKCGFSAGKGDKFCASCGTSLIDGAEFCVGCGEKTEAVPVFEGQVKKTGKSRIAAGILGILLGCLGIHNFYLGYTGKAVIQLLMTVLSCGFLAVVSEIWGLVEGILILTGAHNTDANGMPLSD